MPTIGGFELLLLAILALIVVGPKDLPRLMRTVGRFAAKAKAMADDFRASFDDMAREAELEELRNQIKDLRTNNPMAQMERDFNDAINPVTGEMNTAPTEPTPPLQSSETPASHHGHEPEFDEPEFDEDEDYLAETRSLEPAPAREGAKTGAAPKTEQETPLDAKSEPKRSGAGERT